MMTTITTSRLDKRARAALPPQDFAVPAKRKLPINDEHHVRLAWSMVDRTQGLTSEEMRAARQNILARAKTLNLDMAEVCKVKGLTLECMSLNIAADDDHPNKMPFTGVLTKVDEPSDAAPGGSGGRRVILSAEAARRGLGSLLGMAVDFTPSFDGHDVKNKIGLITSADVVGSELQIGGFIYAADFPETASLIQSLKSDLGFSFEAQRIFVEDMSADILRITDLTFTGAAILLKDKAAYTTTSLAASAENEDLDMTAEELKILLTPLLAEAVKPFTDRLTKLETDTASMLSMAQASAKIRNDIEPLAAGLDAQAAALEAAGVNADALRRQAAHLRSEAAAGRKPTALAAAGTSVVNVDATNATDIPALIAAALKPLQNQLEEAQTQLTDVKNTARLAAAAPGRKTVAPAVTSLLGKTGITLPEGETKLKVADVDTAMASANLNVQQRIMLKNELGRIGAL